MNRALQILLVVLLLPVALPLIAATALAVWIVDGRPILYRHERAGLGGNSFHLLKFRTMRPGPGDDAARITWLGARLRRWSLDELPELFNILKGDMAFVGPRPLPVRYLPRYTPRERHRHDVRPGLTGLAQIAGRNAIGWEEKFRLDLLYVRRRTLCLDLTILLKTPLALLSSRGTQPMPELRPGEACSSGSAEAASGISDAPRSKPSD